MSLVSVSVFDSYCSRYLVPWTIHELDDERISPTSSWQSARSPCRNEGTLLVTATFGNYLKYQTYLPQHGGGGGGGGRG